MAHLLTYGGKTCDKEDCSQCDKCIFDENEIIEGNLVKDEFIDENLEDIKFMDNRIPKNCNTCQYAKPTLVQKGTFNNFNNWHCTYNGTHRLIDISVSTSKDVEIPKDCPCKFNEKNQVGNNIYTPLSYSEKRNIFESIKPLMSWDDIKEKEVYHVPPLPSETRKDIYIISKNDFSCTYRVLSSSISTSNGTILTMYKTSLMHKFLVKHKLREIEVVNVTSNK